VASFYPSNEPINLESNIAIVQPLTVPVSVALDGQVFAPNPQNYVYFPSPQVRSISPSAVPKGSGSVIVAVGSGFVSVCESALCRFGDTDPVEASVLSTSILACVAPIMPSGVLIPLEISLNSFTFEGHRSVPVLLYAQAPVITSFIVDPSGVFSRLSFDVLTDGGGYLGGQHFQCSMVLDFDPRTLILLPPSATLSLGSLPTVAQVFSVLFGTNHYCSWSSASLLDIFMSDDATIIPGVQVSSKLNAIFRRDEKSLSSSNFKALMIASSSRRPRAGLVAPSTVGTCTSFLIGAFFSSGGAGRPVAYSWFGRRLNGSALPSRMFDIISTRNGTGSSSDGKFCRHSGCMVCSTFDGMDVSCASSNVSSATYMNCRCDYIPVPPNTLEPGTYIFGAELRNWLGAFSDPSEASNNVTVVVKEGSVLSLTLSPSDLVIYRDQNVLISAQATVSDCADVLKSPGTIRYFSWQVQQISSYPTVTIINVSGIDLNDEQLHIPPFTLSAGSKYRLLLQSQIGSINQTLSATSSAVLTVMSSPISILVSQGDMILASVWSDLVIDTCATRDVDGSSNFFIKYSCSFPQRPGIVCSDLDSNFAIVQDTNKNCSSRIPVSKFTGQVPLPVGESILLGLQAFRDDQPLVVAGTLSVAVLVTSDVLPIVSVEPVRLPIIRSGLLLFSASVLLPHTLMTSNVSLNYSWSIPDMAGRPVPLYSKSNVSDYQLALSEPGTLSLVLNSSCIPSPLFVLKFTATPLWRGSSADAVSRGIAASSVRMLISVRGSPAGGSFSINTLKGQALFTTFVVSAAGWQDSTSFLVYYIRYLSDFNSWEEIARSTQSQFSFRLPFGNYKLQLLVENGYGSTTTTSFCNGVPCVVEVDSISGINTDDTPQVLTSAFEAARVQASSFEIENFARVIAHELNFGSPPVSRLLSSPICEFGCLNGATCISGCCICRAGYSGPVCSVSSESWNQRLQLRAALISYGLARVSTTFELDPVISSRLQLLRVLTAAGSEISQSSANRLSGVLFGLLYQILNRKRKLDQVAFAALAGTISNVVAAGASSIYSLRQDELSTQKLSSEEIYANTTNLTYTSNSTELDHTSYHNSSSARHLLSLSTANACDIACSVSKNNTLMILLLIFAAAPQSSAHPPASQSYSTYAYSVVKIDVLIHGNGEIRAQNSFVGRELTARGAKLRVPFIDFPSCSPDDLTDAAMLTNGDLASGTFSTASILNRRDDFLVLMLVSFGPGASPLSWHPSDSSVISDVMAVWVTPATGPVVVLSVPKNISNYPPAWLNQPVAFFEIQDIKLRRAVNSTIFPNGNRFVPVCSLWVTASNNFSLEYGNFSHSNPIGGNGYWSDGACYATKYDASLGTVNCHCSSTGLVSVREYPAGCDGVPLGEAVLDQCNVCGGIGTSCLGCDNVPFSGKIFDSCGVCDGDDSSCNACKNPCSDRSRKFLDACGVCGGDNKSCTGCDGIVVPLQVTARTGLKPKAKDACGICGGSGKSCAGCDGVPHSGKEFDLCGVCDPPLAERNICPELPSCQEGSTLDACGICVPLTDTGGLECVGCDLEPRLYGRKLVDACGVCGGDNSSCVDCLGVPNGRAVLDKCGICNGNNRCADCCGEPFGSKKLDVCGICNGPNNSAVCTGCDGLITPPPRRPAVFDSQMRCCPYELIGCNGLCGAVVGCDGVCQKNFKKVDKCGICGGQGQPSTGVCDCAAVPNGTSTIGCDGLCRYEPKVFDKCNVCGGSGLPQTGICDCKTIPDGEHVVDALGFCCHPSEIGCDNICFSGKLFDGCSECAGDFSTCSVFDSSNSIFLGRPLYIVCLFFVIISLLL
jgi:hypothetical protein